jgi:membrane-bound metal-dependent hydrolase YbcI (DUF457 family)
MDNLTHSLFAATLARTRLGRAGRGATAVLVLASNAPDIDIVAAAGGAASYLQWHRGPTHGALAIVVLGLSTAALVWAGRRLIDQVWMKRVRIGPERKGAGASFAALSALSMLGVVFHVLMDLPTPYGTRMLSPFDWDWYAVDWMPIIDIYLVVILLAGLLAGEMRQLKRSPYVVLLLMAANYGIRATAHHQALTIAPLVLGSLPERCAGTTSGVVIDRWPQNAHHGRMPCLIEIAAIPTFTSPFHWRLIAQSSNGYDTGEVSLLAAQFHDAADRETSRRVARRYSNHWTPTVMAATHAPAARTLLGFSRFPLARTKIDHDGVATVQFIDLRYVDPADSDERRGPRGSLFMATIRVARDGQILQERLGP